MRNQKKLTTFTIAVKNLKAQNFRTWLMLTFVFLMSATLFFSTFVTKNLEMRISKVDGRMGADMIVVSDRTANDISESLFSGNPCTVWFNKESLKGIRNIAGVEAASPQLYIATLNAGCCAVEAQLIAFDPETDFTVQSWLESSGKTELAKGEVIIGSSFANNVGGDIRFFNTNFKVAHKLEPTGMGYDRSVFMTYETAMMLKDSPEACANMDVSKLHNSASMILVKKSSDITDMQRATLKNSIYQAGGKQKLSIFTPGELMSSVSEQIGQLSGYGTLLTILTVIAAALALICIFVITMNERKSEFGILISIGAKPRQLSAIVYFEALIIGVVGAIAGVLASLGLIAAFSDILSVALDVPSFYMQPGLILSVSALALVIALLTAVIAAFISSSRINKAEPCSLIKEGSNA